MAPSRRMKSRLGKGTRKRTSKRIRLSKRMRKGTKRFSKKSKNMRGGGLFDTDLGNLLQKRLKCGTQSKGRLYGKNPMYKCDDINDLDEKINNELITNGAKLSENSLTEIDSEFKDNTGNVVRPVFIDYVNKLKEQKRYQANPQAYKKPSVFNDIGQAQKEYNETKNLEKAALEKAEKAALEKAEEAALEKAEEAALEKAEEEKNNLDNIFQRIQTACPDLSLTDKSQLNYDDYKTKKEAFLNSIKTKNPKPLIGLYYKFALKALLEKTGFMLSIIQQANCPKNGFFGENISKWEKWSNNEIAEINKIADINKLIESV